MRLACGRIESRAIRDMIRNEGRRQDGRDVNTVRPISSEGDWTESAALRNHIYGLLNGYQWV